MTRLATTGPLTAIDFYKADHRNQYPKGTELVFSNWTPRSSRLHDVDKVVFFGLQYFVKEYLVTRWNRDFFDRSVDNRTDGPKITSHRRLVVSKLTRHVQVVLPQQGIIKVGEVQPLTMKPSQLAHYRFISVSS